MSKKPTQKLAPIQDLPTTLLLNVVKYLPTHSVVALSLTCKTLYADEVLYGTWKTALRKDQRYDASYNGSNSLGPSIKSLQTRSLTRLLERDMPSHFSCNICSRLHPQRDLLKFMTRADCDSWDKVPDTRKLVTLRYMGSASQFRTLVSDFLPACQRYWKRRRIHRQ